MKRVCSAGDDPPPQCWAASAAVGSAASPVAALADHTNDVTSVDFAGCSLVATGSWSGLREIVTCVQSLKASYFMGLEPSKFLFV